MSVFAALKSINLLNAEYGVRFEAILTLPANKAGHPMERMFQEPTHRSRPYRPQTRTVRT